MIYCLAQHARYACRHSGACCSSGWPIHVEASRLPMLRTALADGRVEIEDGADDPFDRTSDMPDGAGAVLRLTAEGRCVFHDRGAGRCRIHSALGHASLPVACQQFPRRSLIERDATFVSLSHYCPTVARMAFDASAPLGIVAAPATLVGHLRLEGLDAREALPPVLRPGMLTGLDGYRAWEAAVALRLERSKAPERTLDWARAMTRTLARWQPREGPFDEAVRRAVARDDESGGGIGRPRGFDEIAADHECVRLAVPEPFRPSADTEAIESCDRQWVTPGWDRLSAPVGRFMAAHAFGNWAAYFCTGLEEVVRTLDAALAVVRVEAARQCRQAARTLDEALLVEAFRAADLLLVHLADPEALAARVQRARA